MRATSSFFSCTQTSKNTPAKTAGRLLYNPFFFFFAFIEKEKSKKKKTFFHSPVRPALNYTLFTEFPYLLGAANP